MLSFSDYCQYPGFHSNLKFNMQVTHMEECKKSDSSILVGFGPTSLLSDFFYYYFLGSCSFHMFLSKQALKRYEALQFYRYFLTTDSWCKDL